jgi:hypothetical protein
MLKALLYMFSVRGYDLVRVGPTVIRLSHSYPFASCAVVFAMSLTDLMRNVNTVFVMMSACD